jgi:Aldo/keto reductase family
MPRGEECDGEHFSLTPAPYYSGRRATTRTMVRKGHDMSETSTTGMPYRALGRTGERVSAIGLGGWHLSLPHVDEALSLRIVRTAIDRGITFMDNSWDYNEGKSEIRMGKLARTAKAASTGEFEPFKTTSIFDATASHPEWLGEEPERVQRLMPA